jgi:hypothetical protein
MAWRRWLRTWEWFCALALVALATGCAGSSSSTKLASRTQPIDFESTAVLTNGAIRPGVSCGSGSLWLPLKWGEVPTGTVELAVYIGRYEYKQTKDGRELRVPFGDLLSRIDPTLRGIAANTVPQGATWSTFGAPSCPPVRRGQHVLQELFALDRSLAQRELGPRLATRLTKEALRANGEVEESVKTPGALTGDAVGVGRFFATYAP